MNVYEYYVYIGAFSLAFLLANITTPISKWLAYKFGAIAYPNEKSMHDKPMPLGGGLSIYIGFVITILIFLPAAIEANVMQLVGLIIGATIITVVGLLDDIYSLSPKRRILFQVLSALIVILTGTSMDSISIPLIDVVIEFGIFSNVITIIWIVGITNAVNLIDGLDGLAAGVASIAFLSLFAISVLAGDPVVAGMAILLTATLSGACLGFLPHNFNPAKIFMGDTGSTFLGFCLAVVSIQTMLKTYTAITLIAAVIVLGLPIFDTFFAIFRRTINRRPISEGDKGHLHHRLMDRGLSEKKAVLTLYVISGSFGIAGVLIALQDIALALIIVGVILAFWLADMIHNQRKINQKKQNEENK